MLRKISLKFNHIYKKAKKTGFKKVFPLIYSFILLLGIIFTFLYAFIPSFVTCSSIFGNHFCTPTGLFIALFASIPGYIISGNILYFLGEITWALSFLIIIATSFVFYYIAGLLVDNYQNKKLSPEYISKVIIIVCFVILFILFVSLF